MFAQFRRLSEAVQAIAATLAGLLVVGSAIEQRMIDAVELRERLDALERGSMLQAAEADAVLVRAETTFKAARASEERERGMAKRAEALRGSSEGETDLPPEYLEQLALLRGDVEGGGEPTVQDVHPGVALVGKDAARASKFGVA